MAGRIEICFPSLLLITMTWRPFRAPAVWTFSCAYSKRPKDERKTAQGFSPGKVRRLAVPKQDRIMLPAGLDILGRPKGENRIAHGLQPWEDGPERNRPERAAE